MSDAPQFVKLRYNGIELAYYGKIDEDKVPLVFVHGAGGNGLLWKQQLKYFAGKYSSIALDLPGHGNSGGDSCQSVSLYRDYIKDFKDSLSLPSIVFCGHSLGGAIALDFQFKYPEDTKAIILVATGGRLRVATKILERYGRDEKMPEMAGFLYGSHAPENMVREGEKYITEVPARIWYDDFTACNNFDVLGELHKTKVPALILCGEEDQMTPHKYSHFLEQNIKGAKLELFPGAGHMLMLEKPREINKTIERFLEALKNDFVL